MELIKRCLSELKDPSSPFTNIDIIRESLKDISVYQFRNVTFESKRDKEMLDPYFFNYHDAIYPFQITRHGKFREDRVQKLPIAMTIPYPDLFESDEKSVDISSVRFVPDMIQVKSAIKIKSKAGGGDSFSGVPIFQSDALRMFDINRPKHSIFVRTTKYRRPLFFKKEDLEKALDDAKEFDQRDIQVIALEDIIRQVKDCSTKWDDAVFIPPGGNPKPKGLKMRNVMRFAAKIYLAFL